MKVILISGWKRSGKDTSADYLVEKYGFERISFASPLKDIVSQLYDIPRTDCDNQELKEKPLMHLPAIASDDYTKKFMEVNEKNLANVDGKLYWTIRALCIMVGSTNRAVRSDFWVKKAVDEMKKNPEKVYIISDVRYKTEMKQILEFAGKENVTSIRIERFATNPSTDASEIDLDDYVGFDHIISNTGTLEGLKERLDVVVSSIV
jgi:hypothetical protein